MEHKQNVKKVDKKIKATRKICRLIDKSKECNRMEPKKLELRYRKKGLRIVIKNTVLGNVIDKLAL